MKKMMTFTGWLVMTATLFAGITACNKVDNIVEDPAPTTYTLTVQATKGDDVTRALALGGAEGKTLNATWTAGDAVQAYHVSNPGTLFEAESSVPDGTLYAQSSGASTTLTGTFSGYTPVPGDVLRLRFIPDADYTNQDGTLEYIAEHCDNAVAEITVASVDAVTGDVTSTAAASFENRQAIVKFSLKQPDGTTPLAVTNLTVKAGGWTYNVTPAVASSDLYVAVKSLSDKAVLLRATDGTDHYRYEKAGVSFDLGQYYAIGVKMVSLNLSTFTSHFTAQDGDILTGTLDGTTQKIKVSIADGATVTLSGVTINGVHVSENTYTWAGITCIGNATLILADGTTNTVKGFEHNYPGIQPAVGKTLTIQGTGTLNARSNGNGPGIGGGYKVNCGNIHIKSGTINATGGSGSAAIGCGINECVCGNITISGGSVVAQSGSNATAIGCGFTDGGHSGTSCGNILIEGGTIVAYHTNASGTAVIGSTISGTSCTSVTVTTGITSLTLTNPTRGAIEHFIKASTVMMQTYDITSKIGTGVYALTTNDATFKGFFPNSTWNDGDDIWTIAP